MSPEAKLNYLSLYMTQWVAHYPIMKRPFEEWLQVHLLKEGVRCAQKAALRAEAWGERKGVAHSGRCHYCHRSFANVGMQKTVDHVVPLSRNGLNVKENRVAACRECNQWKADKTLEEWLHELRILNRNRARIPYMPSTLDTLLMQVGTMVGQRRRNEALGIAHGMENPYKCVHPAKTGRQASV